MRTKTLTLVYMVLLISVLEFGLPAQNVPPEATVSSQLFSLQELREDFSQLRRAVEGMHPALYDFLPKAEFDRLFEKRYAELYNHMSLEEAFQVYASLLASVGCLHTNAWMPKGYWSNLAGKLFPIKMKFVGNSVFAVGSYHETDTLPVGSKILAINKNPMTEILKELKTVISADFFSNYYKNFRLGFRFPLIYSLFFGHPDSFVVTYCLPDSKIQKNTEIRPVPTNRIWSNMRDPRRLELEIKSEIETAIMTITDFSYYSEHDEFFSFIDSAFQEISTKGINNLILDLRLNSGGDPFCAAHLFSYIEHEPVPYFSKPYGKYAKLAEPIPLAKNRFQGKLYILIDGGCASTTGHLCGLLRFHKLGTFIGEETGATYTCNDAHRSFLLGHTRLQVGIATGTFATAVQGLPKNQGIPPDFTSLQTPEDLSAGKDTAFEYVLNLCSRNTPGRIVYKQHTLPLYPETLEERPDMPSPYTDDGGTEIVLACLKDSSFALIPVTVENGSPLLYSYKTPSLYGKDTQLSVNGGDFPALAKTGLHSEAELDKKERITGIPISLITIIGRPDGFSYAGFLAEDEDIISVLKGDNRHVRSLGLTHPDMARPLFHVWNIILKEIELGRLARFWSNIPAIYYNGRKIFLTAMAMKGWQDSIFHDDVRGRHDLSVRCELTPDEKAYLETRYSHLTDEQMGELEEKLCYINFSEMVPFYIMRYGFYEGHTDYRADPLTIAFMFGLKSLEELHETFQGKLYEVLTAHFTQN